MYGIYEFGKMIRDKGRMDAYVGALRAAVRPDSVVLDIGTGTGIFALLAGRFGARKVYAVEPGESIQLGKLAAAANGLADRIQFIQGMSTKVELPEKVNIAISDIHGVFPVHQQSLFSIMDARDRLIAPGGTLIPQRDTVWAALLYVPEAYATVVEAWENNGHGLNQQFIRELAINNLARHRLRREDLVVEPRCWATVDYHTLSSSNIGGRARWTLDRAVTVQGIAVWFDCETADGFGFSNIPGSRTPNVYGDAFFPWPRPVELSVGDCVSVQIRADSVGGEYVWGWNTDVTAAADATRHLASFRQSTFQGAVVNPAGLRKRARSFVPALSEDGRIDCAVLQQMAERLPLGKISQNLAIKFPERFPTPQDALNYVADLSGKYSL